MYMESRVDQYLVDIDRPGSCQQDGNQSTCIVTRSEEGSRRRVCMCTRFDRERGGSDERARQISTFWESAYLLICLLCILSSYYVLHLAFWEFLT